MTMLLKNFENLSGGTDMLSEVTGMVVDIVIFANGDESLTMDIVRMRDRYEGFFDTDPLRLRVSEKIQISL